MVIEAEADLTCWELHKLAAIANVEGDQRSEVAEAFGHCDVSETE